MQKKYYKSEHGSKITKLFLKDIADPKPSDERYGYSRNNSDWFYEESPGVYVECATSFTNEYDYDSTTGQRVKKPVEVEYITKQYRWTIKDGALTKTGFVARKTDDDSRYYGYTSAMAAAPGHENEFKRRYANNYGYGSRSNQYNFTDYIAPTISRLYAQLESGAKVRLEYNTFGKDNGK